MKKKLLLPLVLLTFGSSIGFAQLLNVESTQKVALPAGTAAEKVTLSPNGDYMLVSDFKAQGLQRFDMASGSMTTVTTAFGSEYNAQISADGNTIIYRESQIGTDRLKRTALKSVNLATGKTTTIVDATRNLRAVELQGNAVVSVNKRKVKTVSIDGTTAKASKPVAFVEYGQLMLSTNGKVKKLSPNGTTGQSYLWPSVSPDGQKVVYYLAGMGTFVCNIDGTNPTRIGSIRSPKWYNNDIVVGMNDTDNGEYVTASEIIAISADGTTTQVLTSADQIAMYPSVAVGKIAYTTTNGEAYIINVK